MPLGRVNIISTKEIVMARFIKHVGKQGDRKVAVIFREIPGENHMCLVVYTETLGQNVHDPLMATIESAEGQASDNLGDALSRTYTKDGQIILHVLHREGMMKKVQTKQVLMTPAPNQQVKLDELNKILNEMAMGEEAVKRLAEIDASRGLQDPKDVAKRMRGESTINKPDAMGNSDIAANLRNQATRMANEAKGLLAESERLLKEAATMDGVAAKKASGRVKKVKAVEPAPEPVAPAKATRKTKKAAVAG